MAEVPEHLLQRSKERRKALGLPVPGEEAGDAPAADAAPTRRPPTPRQRPRPPPRLRRRPPRRRPREDVETASGGKIPAHLLERCASGGGPRWPAAATPAPRPPAAGGGRGRHRDRRAAGARRSPAPAVTPSGCSPSSSRARSSRRAPRRRTRCTPGRTCSSIEFASILIVTAARHDLLGAGAGAAARRSPTSTRRRTRRRRRGTSSACRSCSRCSTRWSRA